VVSNPRRAASIAFTLTAIAEFTLFELLPTFCGNEYLGSFNTPCVPDDTNSTLLAAGLDSAGIRLGFNFSPGFLRRYKRWKKEHGKASYDQQSFLQIASPFQDVPLFYRYQAPVAYARGSVTRVVRSLTLAARKDEA
jgi:hypothetical protein